MTNAKYYILFILFCTGCSNHELRDLGKYQDIQDMNRMKYVQELHDEKVRKDRKYEHRSDILFNLEVTRQQISIDNKKMQMLDRYHIPRDDLDHYNEMLNKDRARLENEDGIARSDDVPTTTTDDSQPDDEEIENNKKINKESDDIKENENTDTPIKDSPERNVEKQPIKEEYKVQEYTVPN